MSAWYVYSAMGFYPVNPADGKYVFGTPLFKEINLNIPGGKTFTIKAIDLSEKNIYIKKVLLNGTEYKQGYVTHSQILKGGTLELQMSSKPGSIFIMD
jgi:putative alpha-1,2-mannosidase